MKYIFMLMPVLCVLFVLTAVTVTVTVCTFICVLEIIAKIREVFEGIISEIRDEISETEDEDFWKE